MDDHNFCSGCVATSRSGKLQRVCFIGDLNDKGNCPCVNCIIKMMCSTMCEMRETWYLTIMR